MTVTQSRLIELFNYEESSGNFIRKTKVAQRVKIGDIAGSTMKTGYIRIEIDGRKYMAHVLAWIYKTGNECDVDIDHINGIRCDNRWKNLRRATRSENCQNRRVASSQSKTGFLGVSLTSQGKFQAEISNCGNREYLGVFKIPELAYQAYIEAKRELHSHCTI